MHLSRIHTWRSSFFVYLDDSDKKEKDEGTLCFSNVQHFVFHNLCFEGWRSEEVSYFIFRAWVGVARVFIFIFICRE